MPPTFMCIGAQKGGTQWLFDQLCSHPGVWMPPIKELRFFAGKFHRVQEETQRKLGWMEQYLADGKPIPRSGLEQLPPLDESHIEFLRRYLTVETPDAATYRWLFEPAGDRPCGDVTPAYSRLGGRGVSEIAEGVPDVKVVFQVREPVSRLWAGVGTNLRNPRWPGDRRIATDLAALRDYVNDPVVSQLSLQSEVIERWSAVFGDRFRAFVMDDLVEDAPAFRRDVFGFLGLDGDECVLDPGFNRKATQQKVPMAPEMRAMLEEHFAEERERLAQLLGGKAERWVADAAPSPS